MAGRKTWDSQRISGNPSRKFMAVPGLRRMPEGWGAAGTKCV